VPKIDIDSLPVLAGSDYPDPFAGPCLPRRRRQLGDAAGLAQFGVNLLRLPVGAWSAQRHWHTAEDEFVWVVSGEVVLVEGLTGEAPVETVLRAGDCAGFKAGVPNGHKIENRSDGEAVLLEIGTRNPAGDACDYPDIDMVAPQGSDRYFHRDGTPYPKYDRRT
jgi:uncharacterized cupin superfamily protein